MERSNLSQLLEKSLVLVVTLSMALGMSPLYLRGLETVQHHSVQYIAAFLVNRIRYGVDLVSSNHEVEYACMLSVGADVSLVCNGRSLHLVVSDGNLSVSLTHALPIHAFCDAALKPGVYTMKAAWQAERAEINFQRMVD